MDLNSFITNNHTMNMNARTLYINACKIKRHGWIQKRQSFSCYEKKVSCALQRDLGVTIVPGLQKMVLKYMRFLSDKELMGIWIYDTCRINHTVVEFEKILLLNMSMCSILSLPKTFGSTGLLNSVKQLYLQYNGLTALPDSIGGLQNLRVLHVDSNKLMFLPKSIGKLQHLEILLCSNNSIESLPDELCELTQLKKLYLDCNNLTSLPDSMGLLKKLKHLNIHDNPFICLPNSMRELIQLNDLSISDDKCRLLPDELDEMDMNTEFEIWRMVD